MYPRSHWNYRLIYHPAKLDKDGSEPWYGLHEVYYRNDKPWLYTEEPVGFSVGDGAMPAATAQIEMIKDLARAVRDISQHGVLSESDFSAGSDTIPCDGAEVRRRVPRRQRASKKRRADSKVVRRAKNK